MVLQCICMFCIKNSNLFKDTRKTKATVGLFVVSVHSIGSFLWTVDGNICTESLY